MYAIKMTFTNVRMTFRVPRDTIAGPAPLLYFFLFHTRRIARIDTYFMKNLSSRFTPKINYMRLNRLDLVPRFYFYRLRSYLRARLLVKVNQRLYRGEKVRCEGGDEGLLHYVGL